MVHSRTRVDQRKQKAKYPNTQARKKPEIRMSRNGTVLGWLNMLPRYGIRESNPRIAANALGSHSGFVLRISFELQPSPRCAARHGLWPDRWVVRHSSLLGNNLRLLKNQPCRRRMEPCTSVCSASAASRWRRMAPRAVHQRIVRRAARRRTSYEAAPTVSASVGALSSLIDRM